MVFYLILTWSQITHAKLFVCFFFNLSLLMCSHICCKKILPCLMEGMDSACLRPLEACMIGREEPL